MGFGPEFAKAFNEEILAAASVIDFNFLKDKSANVNNALS